MAAFQVSEEEHFEPREIVRVFSMRIKAQHENDTDGENEVERALVEKFDSDESQQRKRIRQIHAYLNSTKWAVSLSEAQWIQQLTKFGA